MAGRSFVRGTAVVVAVALAFTVGGCGGKSKSKKKKKSSSVSVSEGLATPSASPSPSAVGQDFLVELTCPTTARRATTVKITSQLDRLSNYNVVVRLDDASGVEIETGRRSGVLEARGTRTFSLPMMKIARAGEVKTCRVVDEDGDKTPRPSSSTRVSVPRPTSKGTSGSSSGSSAGSSSGSSSGSGSKGSKPRRR
ncbi:hypothetical protein [Streptomyces sp. NPDC048603]|uniref:hypothetical protein n=1 Tax=Streptomyces sp. NPDC048603 TaxID=3365577 RepID=UPI003715F1AC